MTAHQKAFQEALKQGKINRFRALNTALEALDENTLMTAIGTFITEQVATGKNRTKLYYFPLNVQYDEVDWGNFNDGDKGCLPGYEQLHQTCNNRNLHFSRLSVFEQKDTGARLVKVCFDLEASYEGSRDRTFFLQKWRDEGKTTPSSLPRSTSHQEVFQNALKQGTIEVFKDLNAALVALDETTLMTAINAFITNQVEKGKELTKLYDCPLNVKYDEIDWGNFDRGDKGCLPGYEQLHQICQKNDLRFYRFSVFEQEGTGTRLVKLCFNLDAPYDGSFDRSFFLQKWKDEAEERQRQAMSLQPQPKM